MINTVQTQTQICVCVWNSSLVWKSCLGTGLFSALQTAFLLCWCCSLYLRASKLTFCHVQVAAVREGMSTIIPVPLLSLLTPQQLEQLVCGLPEVSVEMLKKVVRYRDVTEGHQLIGWFWQSLEEFTNEERVLFLRFVSGRSRLPSNPADIAQKFQIIKVDRVRAF